MKNRSLASKLGLFGGAAVAATAGLASLGIIATAAGAQSTVTTTVTDPMGGPLPILGTPTGFTFSDAVTLPTSVTAGSTIALDQTLDFSMPSNLATAAADFSATGFTIISTYTSTATPPVTTTTSDLVDGADTTQASISTAPTNLPLTGTIAQAIAGLEMPMSEADFTAGSVGTATFTQDDITVNAAVVGGVLAGTTFAFTMTPGQTTAETCGSAACTALPAAVLGTVPVTPAISPQTITVTSAAPTAAQAGGATYTPTATASSGLTVTTTVDASSTGCSLSGGVVSFTAAGTCVLDFNQAGNTSFSAAPQVQQSFAVAAAPLKSQTITVTSAAPTNAQGGVGSYTPVATASSGLTVAVTVASSSSSVCSISSGVVTFAAAGGTCLLDFNQAGNSSYLAAPQVTQSFTVAPAAKSPIAPIGGVALAGVAGLGLVVVQRRRSRRTVNTQA